MAKLDTRNVKYISPGRFRVTGRDVLRASRVLQRREKIRQARRYGRIVRRKTPRDTGHTAGVTRVSWRMRDLLLWQSKYAQWIKLKKPRWPQYNRYRQRAYNEWIPGVRVAVQAEEAARGLPIRGRSWR